MDTLASTLNKTQDTLGTSPKSPIKFEDLCLLVKLWFRSIFHLGFSIPNFPSSSSDNCFMQNLESGSVVQGPVAVVVTLALVRGSTSQFMPLIQTNAAKSLADEPECHRFDVCLNPAVRASGKRTLQSVWSSHIEHGCE